jgi:MFS superfamily sulfate permease-like transporter
MALMTSAYTPYGNEYAILLAFLNGIIVFACGVFQLGNLL